MNAAQRRGFDNPRLAGLVAWAALALAIWVIGAGVPVGVRIGLIALVPLAWIGWRTLRASQAREAAAQQMASLLPEGTRDGATAAARPWYLLIGAPGVGKSTLLAQSGLKFQGEAPATALKGTGGTRACDWWMAEEAVLIDTAGRLTTQDSDKTADAAAWFGFLGTLKGLRPHAPLNGVFVTVSASDLMLWNKKERERYAAHVRMRLGELHAVVSQRLPVYVLVTKCDLLAGFTAFFAGLDAAGRAQVWGTTFAHGEEPEPEAIEARCNRVCADLERTLSVEMLDRLNEADEATQRGAIFRFPQQFHALQPLLVEFLRTALNYRVDHQCAMLRGVYFTSGTQAGSPIDRVMSAVARGFSVARAAVATTEAGREHSFFVSGVMRDVVLRESNLASWHLGASSSGMSSAVTPDQLPL